MIQQAHEDITNVPKTSLDLEQALKGFRYMLDRKAMTKKIKQINLYAVCYHCNFMFMVIYIFITKLGVKYEKIFL